MASGTSAAAAFFLGIKSTTTSSLKTLRRQYAQTITFIMRQNLRLRNSMQGGFNLVSGAASAAGAAGRGMRNSLTRPIGRNARMQPLGTMFAQLIRHTMARMRGGSPGPIRNARGQFVWTPQFLTFARVAMGRGLQGMRHVFRMLPTTVRGIGNLNNNLNNANNALERLTMLEALEAFSRGLDHLSGIIERMGALHASDLMAQSGGLSRTDQLAMRETLRGRTDGADMTTSIPGQLRGGGFLAEAGFKKAELSHAVLAFGSLIDQLTRMGADGGEVAENMAVLSKRLGMADHNVAQVTMQADLLRSSFRVSSEQIYAATSKAAVVMQGSLQGMSDDAKRVWMMDLQSATAAMSNSFQNFDMAEFLTSITTGPNAMQTRAQLEAVMGMKSGDLMNQIQAQGIGSILPQLMSSMKKVAGSNSDPAIAAQQLQSIMGPAFAGMSPEDILSMNKASDAVLSAYGTSMQSVNKVGEQFNQRIKDTYTVADKFNILLENLAEHASIFGFSLGDAFGYLAQFRILDVVQTIAGFAVLAGPVMRGLGGIGGILGGGRRGGGAAGGGAGGAGGNWISGGINMIVQAGRGLIELVGMGLQRILGGLGMGLGALLQGVAGGLRALAVPQVALGSLVFVVLAAGVWVLGKALAAAAPGITALLSGIALNVQAVMSSFAVMDWKQILVAGPAMAMMGLGFNAMMFGIVGGMAVLTAGDAMSKFAAFFGVGSGQTMGEALRTFATDISMLGSAMAKVGSSGLVGMKSFVLPLPTVDGSIADASAQLSQVKDLYTRAASITNMVQRELSAPGIGKAQIRGTIEGVLDGAAIETLLRRIADAVERQARGSSSASGSGLLSGAFN